MPPASREDQLAQLVRDWAKLMTEVISEPCGRTCMPKIGRSYEWIGRSYECPACRIDGNDLAQVRALLVRSDVLGIPRP